MCCYIKLQTEMPTILTNRAFPSRRADLAGAIATQDVTGYHSTGKRSSNQIVSEKYYHKRLI